MNKIIADFLKNSCSQDVLLDIYGVSSDEYFDCTFIAPSWSIEKIFDVKTVNITDVYQDQFSKSVRIISGGKKYLYVQLNIGAPNMIDFCLSCWKSRCDKFVFLGSVGALVPELNVGDIVVPDYSISGNGATIYMHKILDASNMFEKTYSSPELNTELKNICSNLDLNVKSAVPISVDSVLCEYSHLSEFRDMGADLIEMETATFFKAMSLINKKASAILIISDNSAVGQHLVGETTDVRAIYHATRDKIKDILLAI